MVVRRLKSNELYHHGIKGQRWGVRRYQNSDGSLTNAGRVRYNDSSGGLSGRGKDTSDPRAKARNSGTSHSTGKSKGVKRRGDKLDTNGPVGGVRRKSSKTDGDYGMWLFNQHNNKSSRSSKYKPNEYGGWDVGGIDLMGNYFTSYRARFGEDDELGENEIGVKKVIHDDGLTEYQFCWKDANTAYDYVNSKNATSIFDSTTSLEALAQLALSNGGKVKYDPRKLNGALGEEFPFTVFENVSDLSTVSPSMSYWEQEHPNTSGVIHYNNHGINGGGSKKSKNGFDQKKQDRLAEGAAAKEKLHKAQNKKFSTKAKRFVDSWNEVRYEEIEKTAGAIKKGKAKVKSLFNSKK